MGAPPSPAAGFFGSGAEPASKPEKAAEGAKDGQLAPKSIAVSDETSRYVEAAGCMCCQI